jgi:hypothetical protein
MVRVSQRRNSDIMRKRPAERLLRSETDRLEKLLIKIKRVKKKFLKKKKNFQSRRLI